MAEPNDTTETRLSDPKVIEAPPRTGTGNIGGSTTAERVAKLDLPPLQSQPPSNRAEAAVQAAVDEEMHNQYVADEARRRVGAAKAERLMSSVNTQNPYGLQPGEKPVYLVNGWLVDPDGTRIAKAPDSKPIRKEIVVDRATSMKQM